MRRCVPLLMLCTVWLCCATLLCCRPCPGCVTVLYAVPLCPTRLYSSPAVLCSVSTMLCMSVPPCRRRRLVMAASGRVRARSGAPYQCLPTPETKPKTKWSCMWNTLPNLTGSCARGANAIGAFGLVVAPLPMLTISSIWLHRRSLTLLPIITGRVININSVHNWQDTHMITGTILWILIVGLLAYAAYLRNTLTKR